MTEKYTTPGVTEVHQVTVVDGQIVIQTGFAEIYDYSIVPQSGEVLKGAEVKIAEFWVEGDVSAAEIGQGGAMPPQIAVDVGQITRVLMFLETDGAGTTTTNTTIDVDKNGTTIFTTQGNRPAIAEDAGSNQTDEAVINGAKDIEAGTLAKGDRIQCTVDEVPETTAPTGLRVVVMGVYNSVGPRESFSPTISGGQLTLDSDNPDSDSDIEVRVRGRY